MTAPTPRKTFTVEMTAHRFVLDKDGERTINDDGEIITAPETREIIFIEASGSQLSQIARGAAQMNRGSTERIVNGIGKVLEVLDTLILRKADHEWLEDTLNEGSLDVDEFTKVLEVIGDKIEEESKPQKAAKSGRR